MSAPAVRRQQLRLAYIAYGANEASSVILISAQRFAHDGGRYDLLCREPPGFIGRPANVVWFALRNPRSTTKLISNRPNDAKTRYRLRSHR